MNRQCKLEDLRALASKFEWWSVNEDGSLAEFVDSAALMDDDLPSDYVCFNCNAFFASDQQDKHVAMVIAWQAALKHLKTITDRRDDTREI